MIIKVNTELQQAAGLKADYLCNQLATPSDRWADAELLFKRVLKC